jgi:hypothetical protein
MAAKPATAGAPPRFGVLQRKCAGPGGECEECQQNVSLQRRALGGAVSAAVPPIVHEVLRSPGQPLDAATRAFMEPRFGHDFGQVHADQQAATSADTVNAQAYTAGQHIVFAGSRYAPQTADGRALLAHELTHVLQQRTMSSAGEALSSSGAEFEAERNAARVAADIKPRVHLAARYGMIQRQLNQAEKAPASAKTTVSLDSPGFKICQRPALGAQHAFIATPHREVRYGLMKRCTPKQLLTLLRGNLGLPLSPTAAEKTKESPDPCHGDPECVSCKPRPGVNLGECLEQAYNAYPAKSEYVVTGPNSNTFAGTLARTCCDGVTMSTPVGLSWMPGWALSPASAVEADCPPGKSQCEDPRRPHPFGRALLGIAAEGVFGAVAGGVIGLLLSLIPGVGSVIGAGALIGAGVFGLVGLLAGLKEEIFG